ncbi:LOW QUALITY PROTEIN: Gag-Pol polyprotein [Plecturocebus cupreus]
MSNLLQALLLPKEVAVIHCQGHRDQQDAISLGNARADMVAKALTSSRPAPAPVLFLTTTTSPMYSPSERQDLILRGGTGSDQGWIFLNNKIALPQEQAPKIITKIHQSLHIGPKALYCFIQPLFYSPGLQQIVEQVHKTCITCSKVSSEGSLRPQYPTHQIGGNLPAQDWQIDFTHMPTHKKLRYLLTFVEPFQETADMVASILTQEIIPRFGLPATIQSDNGPAFIAQVVQLVVKSLNISWKLHIPYHPQSSGKVKRALGILKDHFAKLTIELGSETPHGKQQASASLSCCMASLSWSPVICQYNHLPWPPTFPIYLFSTTYSGSTETALSLLFQDLETHAQQHPCSQVTVFSSGSSNQDLCSPRGPHIIILTTPMAAKLLGHTPCYHVSLLKVAPQNDQWKFESLGPTHLHLTHGPGLPIPDPSNSPPNNPSNISP